jgi:hypothetical protein
MKTLKRVAVAAGVAAALVMIPAELANAYWPGVGPHLGPWRSAYVYDPAYRWGSPAMKQYIRDLYLRGPGYAGWRQQRRFGYWW